MYIRVYFYVLPLYYIVYFLLLLCLFLTCTVLCVCVTNKINLILIQYYVLRRI